MKDSEGMVVVNLTCTEDHDSMGLGEVQHHRKGAGV